MIFGSKNRIVVGVEIGTSKIVVTVGGISERGVLSLLGLGEVPSAGIRKGDIIDARTVTEALRDALLKAEGVTGVKIGEVYLALSGAHLKCEQQRAALELDEKGRLITSEDVEMVRRAAEEISLSPDRLQVATLPKSFRYDGSESVPDPVGMMGQRLEGEFLVVHGVENRLKNIVSRVTDLGLKVLGCSLSPVASADAALTDDQKQTGALVVDMGGGLTHYAVYLHGQIEQLGVVGVGGDHVTQDICRAFNLPLKLSEELKGKHGTVCMEKGRRHEIIQLKPMSGFAGKSIYLESLMEVLKARWVETFSIIKENVDKDLLRVLGAGVILTGGGSRTKGIEGLARQIFEIPAQSLKEHFFPGGNVEELCRPELSTALGMLMHGHQRLMESESSGSLMNRFVRVLQKVRLMV